MKKIDTSPITTGIGFPVKSGSLLFLQQAYTQIVEGVAKSIIGSQYDATKVYILWGCMATGTDPGARTFTEGAIFFNGEVFYVPAASFTSSGSDVAVGTITTTYFSASNADPVTFTDGVDRNVHQIRNIVIAAGVSGSGGTGGGSQPNFDFSNWVPAEHTEGGTLSSITITTGVGTISGSDYNYSSKGGRGTISFQIELVATGGGYYALSFPLPYRDSNVNVYGGGAAFDPSNSTVLPVSCELAYGTPFKVLINVSNLVAGQTYFINGSLSFPVI